MAQHQKTDIELDIISDVATLVGKYKKYDSREDGDYFADELDGKALKAFQKVAYKTAEAIEKQGVDNTYPALVAAAREIAKYDDIGFNHLNTLGFAFYKALKADLATANKKGNPFSNMRL